VPFGEKVKQLCKDFVRDNTGEPATKDSAGVRAEHPTHYLQRKAGAAALGMYVGAAALDSAPYEPLREAVDPYTDEIWDRVLFESEGRDPSGFRDYVVGNLDTAGHFCIAGYFSDKANRLHQSVDRYRGPAVGLGIATATGAVGFFLGKEWLIENAFNAAEISAETFPDDVSEEFYSLRIDPVKDGVADTTGALTERALSKPPVSSGSRPVADGGKEIKDDFEADEAYREAKQE